jgi:hypothetical protein
MLLLGKKGSEKIYSKYFSNYFSSHLSHNNVKVLDHAIWCLTYCAEVEDNRRRIRITGAIPLLLSLLENG